MPPTNFVESLKYLIDTSVIIADLSDSNKSLWSKCIKKYSEFMTKYISRQKMDSSMEETEYLSKMKPAFIEFYNQNMEELNKPIFDSKNVDGVVKSFLNISWIRVEQVKLPEDESTDEDVKYKRQKAQRKQRLVAESDTLIGSVIYQYPGDTVKAVISIPISNIYNAGVFLHENGKYEKCSAQEKDNNDIEFPLRIIYGVLLCIKYALTEEIEILNDNIITLEDYELNEEIKAKNSDIGDIGSTVNQMMNQMGIDSSAIPKGALSNMDPNLMSSLSGIMKNVMEDVNISGSNGKGPRSMSDIIKTVSETLSKPEITKMFGNIQGSTDELINSIPTADTFPSSKK